MDKFEHVGGGPDVVDPMVSWVVVTWDIMPVNIETDKIVD